MENLLDAFFTQPWSGYGNAGFTAYLDAPWLSSMITPLAKYTMACCGPHNELFANMLRSGFFGAFSVIGLFLIPLILFAKNSKHIDKGVSQASQIGLAFISCLTVCSLSMEVFNLKYTSTFYSLMIAGLVAQIANGSTCKINKS